MDSCNKKLGYYMMGGILNPCRNIKAIDEKSKWVIMELDGVGIYQ
jgi:hypothetical protein